MMKKMFSGNDTSGGIACTITARLSRFAVAVLCCLPLVAGAQSASEFLGERGMPYAAFDRLPHTEIKMPSATLQIGFAPGALALSQATVQSWIAHSAGVVSDYYGRFPVASARILIVPVNGRGVRGGTTWAYRGAAIRILLGSEATESDLKQDWMLVHEMVHLALPDLDASHNWLSEGLATYVEPVARAQAGDLTAESIWAAMLRDMSKGLPQNGDQGLDRTHTWGRTYWGGAIFCLLADIEIRKQTKNRMGLQDAMRGVLAADGNHEVDWPITKVLQTADAAVGGKVLTTLYERMATKADAPDLDALWVSLGVRSAGDGHVSFDDAAPLASIRNRITATRNRVDAEVP